MKDVKIKDVTYQLYLSSRQIEKIESEMGMSVINAFQLDPTSMKLFRLIMEGSLQAKHKDLFDDMDIYDFIDEMQQEGWTIEKKAGLMVDLLADCGFMTLPKRVKKAITTVDTH